METLNKLGIDLGSILLYLINMGILLALLSKYVFPKILHFLDERRGRIESNLKEADDLKAGMEKQYKKMEKEQREAREELHREIEETKKAFEKKRRELEAEMELKKTRMLEEGQKMIAQEQSKLVDSVQEQLLHTVEKMVTHILSEKLPKEVIEASVGDAWEKIKKP